MDIFDLVVLDSKGNRYKLIPLTQLEPTKVDKNQDPVTLEEEPRDLFRKTLKKCREEEGITQGQLATESKIKQSNISAIELGRRKPRMETRNALINAWELLSKK